jgi:DNA-binding XRE family transcriptional regulator
MLSYLREEPIDLPPAVLVRLLRGVRIRNARWRLRLTQQQLAERVGVSRQTICTVEAKGTMSRPTKRRLEQALGLNLSLSPMPLSEAGAMRLGGQGETPAHGD